MTFPWSEKAVEQKPIESQQSLHFTQIPSPSFSSPWGPRMVDTRFLKRDVQRKIRELPDVAGAKESSTDAFKEFDEFCENAIRVYLQRGEEQELEDVENYEKLDRDLTKALKDKRVAKNLNDFGIKELNALQRSAIPIIRRGDNTIVFAPTGIGKTYGFLIPAIEKALEERKNNPSRGTVPSPSVLIMANTGTLVKQSYQRCCKTLGLDGNDKYERVMDIKIGCASADTAFPDDQYDIVFATFGKLEALLKENKINFDNLKMYILDEADKMTDGGAFGMLISRLLDNLNDDVRKNLQSCLFSATFPIGPNGLDLNALDRQLMTDSYSIVYCPPKPGYITQKIMRIPRMNSQSVELIVKLAKVQKLIDEDLEQTGCRKEGPYKETIIIFCETVQVVNFVTMALRVSGYNFKPMSRMVAKGQQQLTERHLALKKIHGVVCTNLMSRGIDISSIRHTIVMQMSTDLDSYKHRIGRVGRDGSGGKATIMLDETIINDASRRNLLFALRNFLGESQQSIPAWLNELADDYYRHRCGEY